MIAVRIPKNIFLKRTSVNFCQVGPNAVRAECSFVTWSVGVGKSRVWLTVVSIYIVQSFVVKIICHTVYNVNGKSAIILQNVYTNQESGCRELGSH